MTTIKGVEKELFDLEKRYWQALKDRDVETALKLTDDTCIVTGPQGVGRLDKQSLAKMIKTPSYTLHDVSLSNDIQVRVIDDNVAVLAYRVRETVTVDGRRVQIDAADASTWVRRNGSWVCAMHTEALAGDPFGRDRMR